MNIIAEAIVHRRAPSSGSSRPAKDAAATAIQNALILSELCSDNPYDGFVELEVTLFDDDRVEGDIDNKLKVIQDSMNGIVYEDDKQIDRASIERIVRSETQTIRVESELAIDGFLSEGPAFYICVKER